MIQLGKVEINRAPSPAQGRLSPQHPVTSQCSLYLEKEPTAAHPPKAQAERNSSHRPAAIPGWVRSITMGQGTKAKMGTKDVKSC